MNMVSLDCQALLAFRWDDILTLRAEFQEDLYQVFARAHDGHFVFYPDALTKAIEWGRQRSLVSISEDGSSLPVIKIYGQQSETPFRNEAYVR